jgi:hypothetical protein
MHQLAMVVTAVGPARVPRYAPAGFSEAGERDTGIQTIRSLIGWIAPGYQMSLVFAGKLHGSIAQKYMQISRDSSIRLLMKCETTALFFIATGFMAPINGLLEEVLHFSSVRAGR